MKRQLATVYDHEKDHWNDAISQRTPMRDTCNQSVKGGREAVQHLLGEGRKKADAAKEKKKDLQREGWGWNTQERELREHLPS